MYDRVFVDYAAIAQSLASLSKADVAPSRKPAPKADAPARQQSTRKAEPASSNLTMPVPETISGRHAVIAPRLRDWKHYKVWVAEVNHGWPTEK